VPPPASQLTDHLGYWLRMVSNHVSQAFARKMAGQGVTVAEWCVMRVLYGQDPIPPSVLADRMGLTRGAVTKLADRLIAKALLVRVASASDARAQTLALTEAGRAFVPRLAALADLNEAECFAHLPAADRETLTRILRDAAKRYGLTTTPID
jgi:DNA-binding MarR family transcriptional regulator